MVLHTITQSPTVMQHLELPVILSLSLFHHVTMENVSITLTSQPLLLVLPQLASQ